jgi:hypothetical protein
LVEDLGVMESDGADRRHPAISDLAARETEFPDRLERRPLHEDTETRHASPSFGNLRCLANRTDCLSGKSN